MKMAAFANRSKRFLSIPCIFSPSLFLILSRNICAATFVTPPPVLFGTLTAAASLFPSSSVPHSSPPSPSPSNYCIPGDSSRYLSSLGGIGKIKAAVNGEGDPEPRTGWLHNTQPKYPSPAPSSSSDIDNSPARRMLLIDMMKQYRNHRIINPPAIHPCGDHQRMMVTEHKIAVPLDHPDLVSSSGNNIVALDRINGAFTSMESFQKPTVDVYFTITELVSNSKDEEFFKSLSDVSLTPQQRAERYFQRQGSSDIGDDSSLKSIDSSRMILYLQGGPGFGCASPVSGLSLASAKSSWAAEALLGGVTNLDGNKFEKVVLMDQRGTGKSTPISKQRLKKMFQDLFLLDDLAGADSGDSSAGEQIARAKATSALREATDYFTKFRADSIVRDAEWIKEALINPSATSSPDASPSPWGAALGQSFGGFCLMTYLSSIKNPPRMCLFTGGIAPMDTPVREVYDRLWLRVRERNWKYYEQYPGDVAEVKRIVRHLLSQESEQQGPRLPSGGVLSARRFLQLGICLGGTPGSSFANLHSLINSAFLDDGIEPGSEELSDAFLKRLDMEQSFDDAPLYFLLHESIYADGPSSGSMNWAAHSSYEHYVQSNSEFDYRVTSQCESEDVSDRPTLLFGEMVFPWMAHGDFAEVSGAGMRAISEELASKNDWLPLFDAFNMRAALTGSNSKVRAAAAVYYDDMYVDFNCSMKLVQRGMPLEGCKVWVTNEHQHSGLRDDGASIFKKLIGMAKGAIHVPS